MKKIVTRREQSWRTVYRNRLYRNFCPRVIAATFCTFTAPKPCRGRLL